MLSTPLPSPEETLANSAFDALLWALSRPGIVRHLPAPGEAPVIETLIDRECSVYCADPLLMPQILRTGAQIAELDQADHVFFGTLNSADQLTGLMIGSDLYPDDGATVVIRVRLNDGPALRLTGPGVDGAVQAQVAGLPDGFWQARQRMTRYPMGFDLFLLDGDRVLGVPRSTKVEVL